MADQSVSVSGPVQIESGSKERVAFDLMVKIDGYSQLKVEQKDEKYWLTLYSQCWKAASGHALKSILTKD